MLSQISSYVSCIATKRKQLSASKYLAAKNENIPRGKNDILRSSDMGSFGELRISQQEVDCEQSLFCSKIGAGRTAKSRGRYSSGERRSREPRVAWVGDREWALRSLSRPLYSRLAARGSRLAARGSRLEYCTRFLAAPSAGILEQRRDCPLYSRLAARGSRLAARILHSISRCSFGRDFRAKERLLAV